MSTRKNKDKVRYRKEYYITMRMNPKRESLLAVCLSRDLLQNKRSMMQMASVKNNCNGYKKTRGQITQRSSKLLANETTNNSEIVASTTIDQAICFTF